MAKGPRAKEKARADAARDIPAAVHDVCTWLPEATAKLSHGMRDYTVRGKTFATFAVNHHGDGRVALWLPAPAGAQARFVGDEPRHYFVPPYVGPRGWLGVHLDKGLSWDVIARRVREAYLHVAPAGLASEVGPTPAVTPPTTGIDPEVFDPLSPPRIAARVGAMRAFCLALPGTSEAQQFGNPSWRVGKKTFATMSRYDRRLRLSAWVGPEQQVALGFAPHYRVPPYMGHNGWLDLEMEAAPRWEEAVHIVLISYRHFATRKLAALLDAAGPPPTPKGR